MNISSKKIAVLFFLFYCSFFVFGEDINSKFTFSVTHPSFMVKGEETYRIVELEQVDYIHVDDLAKLIGKFYRGLKYEIKDDIIVLENTQYDFQYKFSSDSFEINDKKNSQKKILDMKRFEVSFIKRDNKLYFPVYMIGITFFDDEIFFSHQIKNEYSVFDRLSLQPNRFKIILKKQTFRKYDSDFARRNVLFIFELLNSYYPGIRNIGSIEKIKSEILARVNKITSWEEYYNYMYHLAYYFRDNHIGIEAEGTLTVLRGRANRVALYNSGSISRKKEGLFYEFDSGPNEITKITDLSKNVLYDKSFNLGDIDLYTINKDYANIYVEYLNGNKTESKILSSKISSNADKLINNTVGYIKLADMGNAKEIISRFKKYEKNKNIIIDVRDCKGGTTDSVGYLISKMTEKELKVNYLPYRYYRDTYKYTIPGKKGDSKTKFIILTNNYTFSGGHIFAAIAKINKLALVIGEKTEGGSYKRVWSILPDGSIFGYCDTIVFMDSQNNDYNYGIEPDIFVADNYYTDEDKVLNRALEEIEKSF